MLDFLQPVERDLLHIKRRAPAVCVKAKKFARLSNCEPKISCPSNKNQSAKVRFGVLPVSRRRSFPWRYKTDLVIVPDGLNRQSCSLCGLSNFHSSSSQDFYVIRHGAVGSCVVFASEGSPASPTFMNDGEAVVRRPRSTSRGSSARRRRQPPWKSRPRQRSSDRSSASCCRIRPRR